MNNILLPLFLGAYRDCSSAPELPACPERQREPGFNHPGKTSPGQGPTEECGDEGQA